MTRVGIALLLLFGSNSKQCAVRGLSGSTARPPRARPSGGRASGRGGRGRGGALGGGAGGRSGRGRGSGSGNGSGNGSNKLRKQNARRRADEGSARKLQADADFFWSCVSKRARGIDFAGVSGKPWRRPSQQELFGDTPTGSGNEGGDASPQQRAVASSSEAKVTRSGGALDIPAMDGFAAATLLGAGLPAFVLDNLLGADKMGYAAPSPIQRHCVPLALAGHDVLASAQTGSGKTVAFLLPLIAAVAAHRRSDAGRDAGDRGVVAGRTPSSPAALVLAPTRELALQIEREVAKLTHGAPPPASASRATRWSACCYGGATARPQLEALAGGVEILVATPGRLADFLDRDLVSLARCRFLVLDEADRMLDMGFQPQLRKIVEGKDLPPREARQTLLFSATFPAPLRASAQAYLRPRFAQVAVGKVGATNRAVEQRLVRIDGAGAKADKLKVLLPLLREGGRQPTIVFTNKKHVANWIARQLGQESIRCAQIHGDRSQGQRETALAQFREGGADVLVATDAVSRGIDIPGVAHVIQFDLPNGVREFESYTHRIGRTGRAGRTGVATAFYVPGSQPKVGNAELWPALKDAFAESKTAVPDWFLREEEQGRRRGAAKRGGPPGRSAGKERAARPPRLGPLRPRASAASGFKNKPRGRAATDATADVQLKEWLEGRLDAPSSKKKKSSTRDSQRT